MTLSDFGVTTKDLGLGVLSNAPVVYYKLKVYSLQLGKYTYTNPDNTPFKVREPEGQDPLEGAFDWFSNPFNLLGLGTFFIVAIGVVTAVALFWFLGIPRRRVES